MPRPPPRRLSPANKPTSPTITPEETASLLKIGSLVGATLFPPAALIAFADIGSGERNPCLKPEAPRGAGQRQASAGDDASRVARSVQKATDKAIKGAIDSIGKGFKSLFGN